MEFTLSDKEKSTLKKWENAIKEIYNEYGSFAFKFTPIGVNNRIIVYSHLTDTEKDITDMDSW